MNKNDQTKPSLILLIIVMIILHILHKVLTNIWLSEWSNDVPFDKNGTYLPDQVNTRLAVYGGLGVFQGQ